MQRHGVRKAVALALLPLAVFAFTACSGGNSGSASAGGSSSASADSNEGDITKQLPLKPDYKKDQALHDALPDSVKKSGTLRVASLATNAPIVFQTEDGAMNGAVADFWAAFEKILGVKIQPQVYANTAAELTALDSGQVDIVWGSDGDTRAREAKYDFVDYFAPRYAIYVKKGNPNKIKTVADICGKSYAGIKGAVSSATQVNDYCAKKGLPGVDEKQFNDAGASLLGIASGQADSWLYFNYFGVWQQAQGSPVDILPAGKDFDVSLAFGVVFPKGNEKTTDAFLQVFNKLKADGYYDKVLKRWKVSELAIEPGINVGNKYTMFG